MWSEFARYFLFRFAIALPLCQKFLFCNCFQMFLSVLNWDILLHWKIFWLLWFAKIDALSIMHVESRFNRFCLVSSCHGSMVPIWWIMSNFFGSKRIWTFQGPRRHFEVGGPILIRNFEIFEKICTYLVNPKILGGPWPPWPPTNEATVWT